MGLLIPAARRGQRTAVASDVVPASLNVRVIFADQLRGIAALLVVLSHMFNVYPFAQPMVSATVAAPQIELPLIWMNSAVTLPWINFGPFGVGLFFLVSGFVIPFSLRRHSRGTFVLARTLRIYLTYWAALAVGCVAVVASARYWGRPVPFSLRTVLANAGLVHTLRGVGSVDQVNWTLVIELHFYLFAALARRWILRRSLWPMAAAAAGGGGLFLVQRLGWVGTPSFLELEAMSLPYMLIGTAVHYHFAGGLRTGALALVAAGLGAVFLGLYLISPATGGYVVVAESYAYALVVFLAAYAARGWLPDVAVLRFLARVSYPLYAVHFLAGLSVMTWLIAGAGLTYGMAGAVTLGLLLLLAWVLHVSVERWTIRYGAALAGPSSHSNATWLERLTTAHEAEPTPQGSRQLLAATAGSNFPAPADPRPAGQA